MSLDQGGLAELSFPRRAAPAPGTTEEIAPGVRWLRMPLPFALNHINLWLIEDGEGWAIVDTGINSGATKELWERVLAEELHGRRVTRLIVTHFHPDHIGLAGWLAERLGIELWATPVEWEHARRALADPPGTFQAELADFYQHVGFAATDQTMSTARPSSYRALVGPVPELRHRLSEGMELSLGGRRWRVIIGRGHAPEHACLYCAELDLLISGDQVLPKISPNVSLWPRDGEKDPLGAFLASLDKLRQAVPASAFVLPSHNLPFYGLHARLRQLGELHFRRLEQIDAACDEPRSTAEIVPLLFTRELDPHQLGFAIGETLAHLRHGVATGRLTRDERPDGVWLFRRA